MTWDEFVAQVEAHLAKRQIPRDTPLSSINWDREAFGGPIPDVYVNYLTEGPLLKELYPYLAIGED